MVQFPSFYGEWVLRESAWQFVVDNAKGGRMFTLREGCKHHELVQMVLDEYKLGTREQLLELTYALPTTMVGPDSPPINVTSDMQVQSLIELARNHIILLCVSCRVVKDATSHVVMGENAEDGDDNCEEVADDNLEPGMEYDVKDEGEAESDEYDDCENVYNVDNDEVKVEDVFKKKAATYYDGEDYELYGKVLDEDNSEDEATEAMRACNLSEGIAGRKKQWTDGIFVQACFDNKAALMSELRMTAIQRKFAFRVDKSEKKLFVARCKVKGCKWMVRGAVKYDSHTFWVTKYEKVHTCGVADRMAVRKRHAPKYIGALFIKEWGKKSINKITPEALKDFLHHCHGIKMSYTTAYRALIHATVLVRGTPEDGYAKLPSYLNKLKLSNPGTRTALEVDNENKFKYLFLAFGASIEGFQYCRRVIVVDGTHLTGRYGGVLLVACGQDANFQIFPLAFGVVDAENDESWEWFFTKLSVCISDEHALVIVSDRHNSIKNACAKVFPWATRGICYYHLQNNIVMKFKGKHLLYLVKNAAYAFTLYDFNRYMGLLREANPELAKYLENADVKLWSRVHFQGDRYQIIISEDF